MAKHPIKSSVISRSANGPLGGFPLPLSSTVFRPFPSHDPSLGIQLPCSERIFDIPDATQAAKRVSVFAEIEIEIWSTALVFDRSNIHPLPVRLSISSRS